MSVHFVPVFDHVELFPFTDIKNELWHQARNRMYKSVYMLVRNDISLQSRRRTERWKKRRYHLPKEYNKRRNRKENTAICHSIAVQSKRRLSQKRLAAGNPNALVSSSMLHVRRQIFSSSYQSVRRARVEKVRVFHLIIWIALDSRARKWWRMWECKGAEFCHPGAKESKTYLWSIAKFKAALLRAKFWVCRPAAAATR